MNFTLYLPLKLVFISAIFVTLTCLAQLTVDSLDMNAAIVATYVYCVVCYHMIAAPHVRSIGHVIAHHYTLDDDSECPIDSELSLFPKVFSVIH